MFRVMSSQSWKDVTLAMRFGSYVGALVVCMENMYYANMQTRTGNNHGASYPQLSDLEIVWPTFWRTPERTPWQGRVV